MSVRSLIPALILSRTNPFTFATNFLVNRIALSTYSLPIPTTSYNSPLNSPTRYVPSFPSFLWTSYNISLIILFRELPKSFSLPHLSAFSTQKFLPPGFVAEDLAFFAFTRAVVTVPIFLPSESLRSSPVAT